MSQGGHPTKIQSCFLLLNSGRNSLTVTIRSTRVRIDTIFLGNFLCLKRERKRQKIFEAFSVDRYWDGSEG